MNKKKIMISISMFLISCLSSGALANAASDKTTTGAVEFISGDLSLNGDKLPSNMDFGQHSIQFVENETWTAKNDGSNTTGIISVQDYRGNPTGWTVKVRQTKDWTSKINSSDKLTGTSLDAHIDISSLSNVGGLVPTGQNAITSNIFTFGSVGEDKVIMSAKSTEGSGLTSLTLNQFDLKVPAASEKRNTTYETSFVWTLSDTPGN